MVAGERGVRCGVGVQDVADEQTSADDAEGEDAPAVEGPDPDVEDEPFEFSGQAAWSTDALWGAAGFGGVDVGVGVFGCGVDDGFERGVEEDGEELQRGGEDRGEGRGRGWEVGN